MKIYTSYFSNHKKLSKHGIVMIGIALFPPKWFYGQSLKMLAPTYSIFNQKPFDEQRYTERFKKEVLANLDVRKVIDIIDSLGEGKDVALCCYEKPEDFCHRHIVAEWLQEQIGIEVEEFVEEQQKPQSTQMSLF